jgi:signal transduction histidine kinase
MHSVTIEDLKNIVALKELPDEHLQWILDHSEYHVYADGDLIAKYGDVAEIMWIALSGKVTYYMYINGRQVYYFTFENDNVTGGVGGLMPYSRMKTYPGYSYALGEVRILRIHKNDFGALEQLNPDFIQKLIGYMTERAKAFATMQLQLEKVNALGGLAAGIAHEFNNPAAAISGISDNLANRLKRTYELTKKLLECHITPAQLENIHELVEKKQSGAAQPVKQTAMQRMENEDAMSDWLQDNGILEREPAETLAEHGFTVDELETIRRDIGADAFTNVIPWLENIISSEKIIKDLADASGRISALVASIKSHVHMDRTNELQPTDIQKDIENTLTLLGFKLREKNIRVTKNFCVQMPEVPAYVGELNQVWTNLMDNAIYALPRDGMLTIDTACDAENVVVSIIDNGNGIPQDNISRIFDPFFTTKKVGDGTGIGLDVVNRIVKRHKGTIAVSSVPGRTEFAVTLPVHQPVTTN